MILAFMIQIRFITAIMKRYRRWYHKRFVLPKQLKLARIYRAMLSIETAMGVLWPDPKVRVMADPRGHLEYAKHELQAYMKLIGETMAPTWEKEIRKFEADHPGYILDPMNHQKKGNRSFFAPASVKSEQKDIHLAQ